MLYTIKLTWPKEVFTKKHCFPQKQSIKITQNCLKPTYRTELQ